jgi:hypothetical protein
MIRSHWFIQLNHLRVCYDIPIVLCVFKDAKAMKVDSALILVAPGPEVITQSLSDWHSLVSAELYGRID